MFTGKHTWQEELAIIDRTMKAISGVTDPDELVGVYWQNIGELVDVGDYVALSRRGVAPPEYLITRSSRFEEEINPWTQRDRLPRLSGGILGEIAYANQPVILDDLDARLASDDPAHFYLQGFRTLIALPQYDDGEGLNVTAMLFPPGEDIDRAHVPVLHWQSGLFGRGTQNLVLRNQLASALATLDRELQTVGDIQRALLPATLPPIPGFELAAHYQTSARAGGDYYDFFPLPDGRWGIFIADVSGHGTPAAVMMAITHALAHAEPGTHAPPGALLRHLNDRLTRSYTKGSGTFVTAFYAVLDPRTRTLEYATAGHNPPRLLRGGEVRGLAGGSGLPLGIVEPQEYGRAGVRLERGDLVLLYTDGITEAMAPAHEGSRQLFGVERLDALLQTCGDLTPEACVTRLRAEVAAFCGDTSPTDDRTIIAMRVE